MQSRFNATGTCRHRRHSKHGLDHGTPPLVAQLKPFCKQPDPLSLVKILAWTGVDIASNCTGAFILVNPGFWLEKRHHPLGLCRAIQTDVPDVKLQPARLITAEGTLFCAGGDGLVRFGVIPDRAICGIGSR